MTAKAKNDNEDHHQDKEQLKLTLPRNVIKNLKLKALEKGKSVSDVILDEIKDDDDRSQIENQKDKESQVQGEGQNNKNKDNDNYNNKKNHQQLLQQRPLGRELSARWKAYDEREKQKKEKKELADKLRLEREGLIDQVVNRLGDMTILNARRTQDRQIKDCEDKHVPVCRINIEPRLPIQRSELELFALHSRNNLKLDEAFIASLINQKIEKGELMVIGRWVPYGENSNNNHANTIHKRFVPFQPVKLIKYMSGKKNLNLNLDRKLNRDTTSIIPSAYFPSFVSIVTCCSVRCGFLIRIRE